MTRENARNVAIKAGNDAMSDGGKHGWNSKAWEAAAKEYHRLMPCPTGKNCETCADLDAMLQRLV